MTFVSVVTNVLSVCRLWPQPRPCHSKTAGTLIIKWQAVRSCRSPSSSLVTGRLTGTRREYSRPSHQPHPMTLLLDKRDTFSLPPFTYIQTLLQCFRILYLSFCPMCALWCSQCLLCGTVSALCWSPAAIRGELPPAPPPPAPHHPRAEQLQDPQHQGIGGSDSSCFQTQNLIHC